MGTRNDPKCVCHAYKIMRNVAFVYTHEMGLKCSCEWKEVTLIIFVRYIDLNIYTSRQK